MKKKILVALSVVGLALSSMATTLKSGESIAFLGDSITQAGIGKGGYVRMCEASFKALGLDIKIIPAGISGNRSTEMLKRTPGILAQKPTYMTLSCGVNDVWHQRFDRAGKRTSGGVVLEDYKKNITQIIDLAQAGGVKVIVLTATMIDESNPTNIYNTTLAPYNEFLREIAKAKGCKLVDLNKEMQKQTAVFYANVTDLNKNRTCDGVNNYLTIDGVHMDFLGNRMMAQMILKDGFAFTAAELAKSEEAILNMPIDVRFRTQYVKMTTGGALLKCEDATVKEDCSLDAYISKQMSDYAVKKMGLAPKANAK